MDLTEKKCRPLPPGTKPFDRQEAEKYLSYISPGWKIDEDLKEIEREYNFQDFSESISFVNNVAKLAEEEDHHPDIEISYSKVELSLGTHSIGGLSENDFILAAKIDNL